MADRRLTASQLIDLENKLEVGHNQRLVDWTAIDLHLL